jgi:predicted MFS family arabinose efflux permease
VSGTDRAPAGTLARIARCFLPFAIAYFFSSLYRGLNAVIGPDLSAEFAIGPAELGLMTSVYFAAFALCQIPIGVALDRIGPRRSHGTLVLVGAVGALLFAAAHSLPELIAGRFLLGIGLSAGLMASFKANVLFWPRERLPLLNGVTMAAGSLGAIAATLPLEWLLTLISWRTLFHVLAGATVLASLALFLAVPEPARPARASTIRAQLAEMGAILRSRFFWTVVPAMTVGQAVYLSYIFFWAGPWLRDVAGLDRLDAATHLALLTAMMALGYGTSGIVAGALARHGVATLTTFTIYIGLFILAQAPIALQLAAPSAILWVLFGLSGSGTILGFTILQQHFPSEQAGRVSSCGNLVIFVLAFLFQWGVGVCVAAIAAQPGGALAHGHQLALAILIAVQLAAWLWMIARSPRAGAA